MIWPGIITVPEQIGQKNSPQTRKASNVLRVVYWNKLQFLTDVSVIKTKSDNSKLLAKS